MNLNGRQQYFPCRIWYLKDILEHWNFGIGKPKKGAQELKGCTGKLGDIGNIKTAQKGCPFIREGFLPGCRGRFGYISLLGENMLFRFAFSLQTSFILTFLELEI